MPEQVMKQSDHLTDKWCIPGDSMLAVGRRTLRPRRRAWLLCWSVQWAADKRILSETVLGGTVSQISLHLQVVSSVDTWPKVKRPWIGYSTYNTQNNKKRCCRHSLL